jgi:hypothetical protein
MHGPTCIFWANLTPSSLKAFKTYDADGSGKIDDEEFSCILAEKTGIKPSAEEIRGLKEEWMGHLHADSLPLDDFLDMMGLMKNAAHGDHTMRDHAMGDPLCLMYYPMRRDCYWCAGAALENPHNSDRAPVKSIAVTS